MTAALDLDALKAAALAAGGRAWVDDGTEIKEDVAARTTVWWYDFEGDTDPAHRAHVVAANPAVMLELLARLELAEAAASDNARDAEILGRAIDRAGAAGGVRAPGMTFSVSNMVALTKKMGAELHACWMAAAARSDAPAPVYDPSLHVPAEIVEAANTVSTWAAKQNRGSWRIGNVCSPDFGGNKEGMARLRLNVAILSAQSEALHLVGHELGLPAGADVVRDVLPKVKHLVMVRNLFTRGPMPGHVTLTVVTERDGVPFTTLKFMSKGKAASERSASEFIIAAKEFEYLARQAFVEVDNFLNAGGAA